MTLKIRWRVLSTMALLWVVCAMHWLMGSKNPMLDVLKSVERRMAMDPKSKPEDAALLAQAIEEVKSGRVSWTGLSWKSLRGG